MNVNRLADIFNRTAEEEDYRKSLAAWQIEHGANRMDMTRAQDERFKLHNRYADSGLDIPHLIFGRRLVETGRCSDGD